MDLFSILLGLLLTEEYEKPDKKGFWGFLGSAKFTKLLLLIIAAIILFPFIYVIIK